MSLGDAVNPEGEMGTLQAPPPMPDQIPDNRATIAATTSIETIEQVLTRNWIWSRMFTIDATMQPGHVFGLMKIHPSTCNPYVAYFAKPFLTYVGSYDIRARFTGTWQVAASVRVGWLPPWFTEEEILNAPIQLFTAYPNRDLDPKNTGWVHFAAPDERRMLFHRMKTDQVNNPDDFSGWYVFYIAAPLVVTGEGNTTRMLVETCGNFDFRQLAPLPSEITPTFGWLDQAACLDLLAQPGCDDRLADSDNAIQICNNTLKAIPNGFANASSTRLGENPSAVAAGSTLGDALQYFRNATLINNTDEISSALNITANMRQEGMIFFFDYSRVAGTIWPFNTDTSSFFSNIAVTGAEVGQAYQPLASKKTFAGTAPLLNFQGQIESTTPLTLAINTGTCSFSNVSHAPVNVTATAFDEGDNSILKNPLPDESIILFVNLHHRAINLQTKTIADALKKVVNYDPNQSQIYELHSTASIGPLMLWRLQPSGIFTTTAASSDILLTQSPGQLYLRYAYDLSMGTPLPTLTGTYNTMRMASRCTKKNTGDKNYWRINFWQHV